LREPRHSSPLLLSVTVQEARDWAAGRLKSIGGKCEICRTDFTDDWPPCFDHDHETGRPRGLLCRNCNWIEGLLRKRTTSGQIEILENMIAWLKQQEIDAASWRPSIADWSRSKPSAVRRLVDGRVELYDGLPLSRHNDLPFILQELPRLEPCTLDQFVLGIGIDVARASAASSRFRPAFSSGRRQKLLEQSGGLWSLTHKGRQSP
jgi:hypothetical protein